MAKKTETGKINLDFTEKLKSQAETPIQKVEPIQEQKTKDEVQISFYLRRELIIKLKVKAAETGKTQKEIITELLEKNL